MSRPIPERLQFFLDRVGKRVYRNDDGCKCEICQYIFKRGLVIHDKEQAQYLYDTECDFNAEGTLLRYFDTKEEVTEWLKSQSPTG